MTATYKIFENAMLSSPGKYHVCREAGDMIESEPLAISERGGFPSLRAAKAWITGEISLAKTTEER